MEQQLGELLAQVEEKFGPQFARAEEEFRPEPAEEKPLTSADEERIEGLFQQAQKAASTMRKMDCRASAVM